MCDPSDWPHVQSCPCRGTVDPERLEINVMQRQEHGAIAQVLPNGRANPGATPQYSLQPQDKIHLQNPSGAPRMLDHAIPQYMQREWQVTNDNGLYDQMQRDTFPDLIWPGHDNDQFTYAVPRPDLDENVQALSSTNISGGSRSHAAFYEAKNMMPFSHGLVESRCAHAATRPLPPAIGTTLNPDFFGTHPGEQSHFESSHPYLVTKKGNWHHSMMETWVDFDAASDSLVQYDDGPTSCLGNNPPVSAFDLAKQRQFGNDAQYVSLHGDNFELSNLSCGRFYASSPFINTPTQDVAPRRMIPVVPQEVRQSHQPDVPMHSYMKSPPLFNPPVPSGSNYASSAVPSIPTPPCTSSVETNLRRFSGLNVSHMILKRERDEVNMNEISQYTDPATEREQERERNRARKRTRKVEDKAKTSCWFCQHHKRKCVQKNGEACSMCLAFAKKYLQGFSLPKFTCDAQTNFTEFNLFTIENDRISTKYAHRPLYLHLKSISHYQPTEQLTGPFLYVFDVLEPTHWRGVLLQSDRDDHGFLKGICFRSYAQSTLRWKTALLLLQPELVRRLARLEEHYRETTQAMLALFADRALYQYTYVAAVILGSMYADVCSMKFAKSNYLETETFDQSAVQHLRSAIEHRLRFLYGILFSNEPKRKEFKPKEKERMQTLEATGPFWKTSRLLPLQYSDRSNAGYWHRANTLYWPVHAQKQYSRCPLPCNAGAEPLRSVTKPQCFCLWAVNCIPHECLGPFGFDPERFCHDVHDSKGQFHSNISDLRAMHAEIASKPEGTCTLQELAVFYKGTIAILLRMYFDCLAANWISTERDWEWATGPWTNDAEKICGPVVNQIPKGAMWICQDFMNWYILEKPSFDRAMEEMEDWVHAHPYAKAGRVWFVRAVQRRHFEQGFCFKENENNEQRRIEALGRLNSAPNASV